jgi:hypothetical protein
MTTDEVGEIYEDINDLSGINILDKIIN